MKHLLAAVTVAAAFAATQAQAVPVTVEYKVTISSLNESRGIGDSVSVESSGLHGFNIAVGETVTGYFTYDTATQLRQDDGGGDPEYLLVGNFQQSLKFEHGAAPITLEYGHYLHTYEGDALRITPQGSSGPDHQSSFLASFVDPWVYAPLNGYLPGADGWSGFVGNSTIEYSYNSFAGTSLGVRGDIVSLRVVSAVPEPATYMMMAGGGLLLLACRRRRASRLDK